MPDPPGKQGERGREGRGEGSRHIRGYTGGGHILTDVSAGKGILWQVQQECNTQLHGSQTLAADAPQVS